MTKTAARAQARKEVQSYPVSVRGPTPCNRGSVGKVRPQVHIQTLTDDGRWYCWPVTFAPGVARSKIAAFKKERVQELLK